MACQSLLFLAEPVSFAMCGVPGTYGPTGVGGQDKL